MRAFILVDDADSMSEFSDELVILFTEPEEENEDFSSVLSSLPSLSSVYNKNENESKCVGIVFGDRFIPTKPKVGKEWMKKSVWGEAGMDKESKEMEEMIMKAIQEEKARMKEEEMEMKTIRWKVDYDDEEVREAEEVEVKEERVPEETKKEENPNEERTEVKEESIPEETKKEEEVKTEIEVKTTKEEEASAEKEATQTEETEEAVVASEAKNPPTVIQNEETPNSFAAVNEETKTDEAEEGLPVQTEEQSKELLRDCLGTIRQQINGVTVTLGLRMGDLASTCTLVVCRKGAYEKFFNMQKDDVPFTVRFMDKRYPFSVGVESSMKEVRQRAISVSSTSSLDE